jgi:hypothetical protein
VTHFKVRTLPERLRKTKNLHPIFWDYRKEVIWNITSIYGLLLPRTVKTGSSKFPPPRPYEMDVLFWWAVWNVKIPAWLPSSCIRISISFFNRPNSNRRFTLLCVGLRFVRRWQARWTRELTLLLLVPQHAVASCGVNEGCWRKVRCFRWRAAIPSWMQGRRWSPQVVPINRARNANCVSSC